MKHPISAWFLLGLVGCGGGQVQVNADTDSPAEPPIDTDTDLPPPSPEPPPPCVEGQFIEDRISTSISECLGALHAFAGPRDALISLQVTGLVSTTTVSIETVGGEVLTEGVITDGGAVALVLPWSGEFLVRLQGDPTDVEIARLCDSGCNAPYTRYPLYFMHGMAGTEAFVNVVDYWFEITSGLVDDGYSVGVGAVDPFQDSLTRSDQWAALLDTFFEDGHHRHVNLIAHSQGGIDARYVTSLLDPDHRVVSVLTVGTPHHGVEVIAVLDGALNTGVSQAIADAASAALGALYGLPDQDLLAQVNSFHPDVMHAFNQHVLDRSDVYYGSWGGRTCALLDVVCQLNNHGEIVTTFLAPIQIAQDILEGDNDGLVSVESARWGVDYGVIPVDHLDEIGQPAGLSTNRFDIVQFYRDEVERLADMGF